MGTVSDLSTYRANKLFAPVYKEEGFSLLNTKISRNLSDLEVLNVPRGVFTEKDPVVLLLLDLIGSSKRGIVNIRSISQQELVSKMLLAMGMIRDEKYSISSGNGSTIGFTQACYTLYNADFFVSSEENFISFKEEINSLETKKDIDFAIIDDISTLDVTADQLRLYKKSVNFDIISFIREESSFV